MEALHNIKLNPFKSLKKKLRKLEQNLKQRDSPHVLRFQAKTNQYERLIYSDKIDHNYKTEP